MKFLIIALGLSVFAVQAEEKVAVKMNLSFVREFKKVAKNKYEITGMGLDMNYKIKVGSAENYYELNFPEDLNGQNDHGNENENEGEVFNPYELKKSSGLVMELINRSLMKISGKLVYEGRENDAINIDVAIKANAELDIFEVPSMKSTVSEEEMMTELKLILGNEVDLKKYQVKKTFKKMSNKCILVQKIFTCKETSELKLQAIKK